MDYDEQAFREFLIEFGELMEKLEPSILVLEDNPQDREYVEEPFRILHSIKGMASFFDLTPVKVVAHRLEDLLDAVREERVLVTSEIIEALFDGADILTRLHKEISAGNTEVELQSPEKVFVETVEKLRAEGTDIEAYFEEFLNNLQEIVQEMLEAENLSADPRVENLNQLILEAEANLEAEASTVESGTVIFDGRVLLNEVDLTEPLQTLEEISQQVSSSKTMEVDEETCDRFSAALDQLSELVDDLAEQSLQDILKELESEHERFSATTGVCHIFTSSVLNHLNDFRQSLLSAGGEIETEETEDDGAKASEKSTAKSFRVAEDKVDKFMDYVGELIITGEMYQHVAELLEAQQVDSTVISQVRETNQSFRELSDNLQESLLEIRRLPLNNLLKKYPVMARKLAADLNKEVEVKLEGEKVEVDKSLHEVLETPLTHLVRNSVDHGIETPEERLESGKEEVGEILISVSTTDEELHLKVKDDGRGLDLQKIKSTAIESGLITEAEADEIDKSELLQYVFKSGFSTAEETTDVSGRGVGLDSVRNSIKSIGGNISVDTAKGEGTSWEILLPRAQTVVVEEGLVVRAEDQQFIVPLENVWESVSLDKAQVTRIEGRGEVLKLRDEIYSLCWLAEVVGLEKEKFTENQVVLILREETESYALVVDEISEQKKVVVQDLGPVFQGVDYASGCAQLGDGTVQLILDVQGISG